MPAATLATLTMYRQAPDGKWTLPFARIVLRADNSLTVDGPNPVRQLARRPVRVDADRFAYPTDGLRYLRAAVLEWSTRTVQCRLVEGAA